MAISRKKFLSGVLGPLVFKVLNGKQVVVTRTAPGTTKQSEATKLWSNTFGMASTLTAQFKQALGFSPGSYTDTDMTNRLNAAVAIILRR